MPNSEQLNGQYISEVVQTIRWQEKNLESTDSFVIPATTSRLKRSTFQPVLGLELHSVAASPQSPSIHNQTGIDLIRARAAALPGKKLCLLSVADNQYIAGSARTTNTIRNQETALLCQSNLLASLWEGALHYAHPKGASNDERERFAKRGSYLPGFFDSTHVLYSPQIKLNINDDAAPKVDILNIPTWSYDPHSKTFCSYNAEKNAHIQYSLPQAEALLYALIYNIIHTLLLTGVESAVVSIGDWPLLKHQAPLVAWIFHDILSLPEFYDNSSLPEIQFAIPDAAIRKQFTSIFAHSLEVPTEETSHRTRGKIPPRERQQKILDSAYQYTTTKLAQTPPAPVSDLPPPATTSYSANQRISNSLQNEIDTLRILATKLTEDIEQQTPEQIKARRMRFFGMAVVLIKHRYIHIDQVSDIRRIIEECSLTHHNAPHTNHWLRAASPRYTYKSTSAIRTTAQRSKATTAEGRQLLLLCDAVTEFNKKPNLTTKQQVINQYQLLQESCGPTLTDFTQIKLARVDFIGSQIPKMLRTLYSTLMYDPNLSANKRKEVANSLHSIKQLYLSCSVKAHEVNKFKLTSCNYLLTQIEVLSQAADKTNAANALTKLDGFIINLSRISTSSQIAPALNQLLDDLQDQLSNFPVVLFGYIDQVTKKTPQLQGREIFTKFYTEIQNNRVKYPNITKADENDIARILHAIFNVYKNLDSRSLAFATLLFGCLQNATQNLAGDELRTTLTTIKTTILSVRSHLNNDIALYGDIAILLQNNHIKLPYLHTLTALMPQQMIDGYKKFLPLLTPQEITPQEREQQLNPAMFIPTNLNAFKLYCEYANATGKQPLATVARTADNGELLDTITYLLKLIATNKPPLTQTINTNDKILIHEILTVALEILRNNPKASRYIATGLLKYIQESIERRVLHTTPLNRIKSYLTTLKQEQDHTLTKLATNVSQFLTDMQGNDSAELLRLQLIPAIRQIDTHSKTIAGVHSSQTITRLFGFLTTKHYQSSEISNYLHRIARAFFISKSNVKDLIEHYPTDEDDYHHLKPYLEGWHTFITSSDPSQVRKLIEKIYSSSDAGKDYCENLIFLLLKEHPDTTAKLYAATIIIPGSRLDLSALLLHHSVQHNLIPQAAEFLITLFNLRNVQTHSIRHLSEYYSINLADATLIITQLITSKAPNYQQLLKKTYQTLRRNQQLQFFQHILQQDPQLAAELFLLGDIEWKDLVPQSINEWKKLSEGQITIFLTHLFSHSTTNNLTAFSGLKNCIHYLHQLGDPAQIHEIFKTFLIPKMQPLWEHLMLNSAKKLKIALLEKIISGSPEYAASLLSQIERTLYTPRSIWDRGGPSMLQLKQFKELMQGLPLAKLGKVLEATWQNPTKFNSQLIPLFLAYLHDQTVAKQGEIINHITAINPTYAAMLISQMERTLYAPRPFWRSNATVQQRQQLTQLLQQLVPIHVGKILNVIAKNGSNINTLNTLFDIVKNQKIPIDQDLYNNINTFLTFKQKSLQDQGKYLKSLLPIRNHADNNEHARELLQLFNIYPTIIKSYLKTLLQATHQDQQPQLKQQFSSLGIILRQLDIAAKDTTLQSACHGLLSYIITELAPPPKSQFHKDAIDFREKIPAAFGNDFNSLEIDYTRKAYSNPISEQSHTKESLASLRNHPAMKAAHQHMEVYITSENEQILREYYESTKKSDTLLGRFYQTEIDTFEKFLQRLRHHRFAVAYLNRTALQERDDAPFPQSLEIEFDKLDPQQRKLYSEFSSNISATYITWLLTRIGTERDREQLYTQYLTLEELQFTRMLTPRQIQVCIATGKRPHPDSVANEFRNSLKTPLVYTNDIGMDYENGYSLALDFLLCCRSKKKNENKPNNFTPLQQQRIQSIKENAPLMAALRRIHGISQFAFEANEMDLNNTDHYVVIQGSGGTEFYLNKTAHINCLAKTLASSLLAQDQAMKQHGLGSVALMKGIGLGYFGFRGPGGLRLLETLHEQALQQALEMTKGQLHHITDIACINFPSTFDSALPPGKKSSTLQDCHHISRYGIRVTKCNMDPTCHADAQRLFGNAARVSALNTGGDLATVDGNEINKNHHADTHSSDEPGAEWSKMWHDQPGMEHPAGYKPTFMRVVYQRLRGAFHILFSNSKPAVQSTTTTPTEERSRKVRLDSVASSIVTASLDSPIHNATNVTPKSLEAEAQSLANELNIENFSNLGDILHKLYTRYTSLSNKNTLIEDYFYSFAANLVSKQEDIPSTICKILRNQGELINMKLNDALKYQPFIDALTSECKNAYTREVLTM